LRGDDCERAFEDDSDFYDVTTSAAGGVDGSVLCAAATEVMTRLAKAIPARLVPRRSLATPSLTRLDLCPLVVAARLSTVPGLGRTTELVPADPGGGCVTGTPSVAVYVQIIFLERSQARLGTQIRVKGQTVDRSTSASYRGCEVTAEQGVTADLTTREELDVQANPVRTVAKSRLCRVAEGAVVKLMAAAGLR
jgi:hypothetical protein